MNFDALNFGIIELALVAAMGIISYLWKTQANGLKDAETSLNYLRVDFAEAKGTASATNRTLFAQLEEMKEAISRIENHLLAGKQQ